MTTPKQTRAHSLHSALVTASKTWLLIVPLGCVLVGASQYAAQAQPQPPAATCGVALDSLMSRWNSIGFQEPSKPAQQIVAGRGGYSTTGGQFNYLRTQIRAAARDCEAGHDSDALRRIDSIRGVLDHLDRT